MQSIDFIDIELYCFRTQFGGEHFFQHGRIAFLHSTSVVNSSVH